jgi:Na+-driven multidrug efflux pump
MKEIGGICFNGSSDMVSNLAEGITVLFMNHLAYRCYGEVGVSALAVVTYVQVLISMVFMGYTSAVEPVFSYHYGSGNVEMRQRVFRLSIRWLIALGVVTMLLGGILAIFSIDLKRTLACSSMSQLGFIFVGIGMQCRKRNCT